MLRYIKNLDLAGKLTLLVLLAMAARALVVVLKAPAFSYALPEFWGAEMASIAASVVLDEGFSSQYRPVETGPTAFLPPLFPYLVSVLFDLFGVYEMSAALAWIVLNILFSSLATIPIYFLGKRFGGEAVGFLSAALWVAYPLSGHSDVLLLWNTSLNLLSLSTIVCLLVHADRSWPVAAFLALGALIGLQTLLEPVVLSVIAVTLVWTVWVRTIAWKHLALVVVAAGVLVAPWLLRNYQTFDQFVFVRSGLNFQLVVGINEKHGIHPNRNIEQARLFAQLGEVEFMALQGEIFQRYIAAEPRQFVLKCAERVGEFWVGAWSDYHNIANYYWINQKLPALKHLLHGLIPLFACAGLTVLWRRDKQLFVLVAAIFVCYPVVFYLTTVQPRHRFAIEPMALVVAACFLHHFLLARLRGERPRKPLDSTWHELGIAHRH
ncbi:MAG: glycosyltransferase family 39 protein [Pseudomonadota bacterium]